MAWNTLLVAILTFATDNRRQKYSSSNYLALLTLRVYLKRRFISYISGGYIVLFYALNFILLYVTRFVKFILVIKD